MQSKTRLAILTLLTMSLLILSQTATYAQEVGVQHENFFVRMFHSFLQVIHVEKRPSNATPTNTGAATQDATRQQHVSSDTVQDPTNNKQGKPPTQEEQKARDAQRLSELVSNGTLTEAQKTAIMTELESMHTKYGPDATKNLSQSEHETQFTSMQQELKDWATKQNIPVQYVLPLGGPRNDDQNRGPRPSGIAPSGTQMQPGEDGRGSNDRFGKEDQGGEDRFEIPQDDNAPLDDRGDR